MGYAHLRNLMSHELKTLPLIVLYLTDGCNSRCVMCDIWRNPRHNISDELIDKVLSAVKQLKIRWVLLSGGEAMQHPQWASIAASFRAQGVYVMMLTNGLLVKKQAEDIANNVDELIVSLDAGTAETYHAIRGVDAFDLVLDGIQAVRNLGTTVSTRTTLQRQNYQEMPQIIKAAQAVDVSRISFLTVDVSNVFAFGQRTLKTLPNEMLRPDDTNAFEDILNDVETRFSNAFQSGQIAESPQKLRQMLQYFRAANDMAEFIAPRCNAPHISVVLEVDGRLRPCYFLPEGGDLNTATDLYNAVNTPQLLALRQAYQQGERNECQRCVCPLYKGPRSLIKL